jgi:hypothetical protein
MGTSAHNFWLNHQISSELIETYLDISVDS